MVLAPEIEERVSIPEGVELTIQKADDAIDVSAKGPKGEVKRRFVSDKLDIVKEGKEVIVHCAFPRKKDKALVGTWRAHLNNMMKGVKYGFEYRMKLVYAHFPVKMTFKDGIFTIQNFLGERSPRKVRIIDGVKVSIKGDEVLLSGVDIEKVGQSAARIEQATRIKGYDPRVFQDGIYIVERRLGNEG